jgi:two-component system response regulator MtrA
MTNRNAHVLVVDDDVRMLRLMKSVLARAGFRVSLAGGYEAALATMAREAPQVVLLDAGLPGPDGRNVCRRIRDLANAPVVMVTARSDEPQLATELKAGADDFIMRPFSAAELVARVRIALRRQPDETAPTLPVFKLNGLTIDFSSRRVMVGDRRYASRLPNTGSWPISAATQGSS